MENINSDYKPSYYNYLLDNDDGTQIIYNTKTGAIDIVESENKDKVEEILAGQQKYDSEDELFAYMMEQGYVIEKDRSEIDDIREWSEMANNAENIANLTILPTETCNFTCPYCFIYTFRDRHMTEDVYDNIFKYIKKFFEKNKEKEFCYLGLSWFGGEPLLVTNQIITFMHRIIELKKQYPNVSMKSEITTNGYLLTYDIFEKLLDAGIDKYQVTLDGDAENHDKLRTLSGKRPTFDTIYKNVLKIKEKADKNTQFIFVIRGNFLRSSIKNCEKLLQMYKQDLSDDNRFRIYFRPVYNFETDRDDISEVETDICGEEEGVAIQNRLSISSLDETDNVLEKVSNPLPMPTQAWCTSIKHNAHIIGYDGAIFSCDTMIVEKDKAIGILNSEGDIILNKNAEIWKKSIFESQERLGKMAEECIRCKLLPVCMGGCNRARLMSGKNPCFWTDELIYSAMKSYAEMYA